MRRIFAVQMPFYIKMDGTPTDTFYLSTASSGVFGSTINPNSGDGFLFSDADIADRGTLDGSVSKSPIRYTVTGTAPNRIFKGELFNAGFYTEFDTYNTMDDSANVQVWYYETSSIIEFRYGPSKLTHAADYFNFGAGPLIAFLKDVDFNTGNTGSFYNLTGNPAAPTIDSAMLPSFPSSALSSWPANGTVYRFTPKTTPNLVHGVAALTSVSVYPTHTAGTLFVGYTDAAAANYTVMTADGRQVMSGTLATGRNSLDVQGLATGMYLLKVSNAAGAGAYRFVKQ